MTMARGTDKSTAELGLFRAAGPRHVPRDRRGRFMAVRYSRSHLAVLAKCRAMRAELGLPPAEILNPHGDDND
jgi:hypothetical protein